MSIRIHLMMGYGLTDINCEENGQINDPRINPNGWLLTNQAEDKEDMFTMRKFRNYVQRELKISNTNTNPDYTDNMIYLNYCKDKVDIHECIQHDSEFGLPNVLCLIPPGLVPKWSRRDDTLDYYMSSSMEPWVKQYEFGNFYPYAGIIDALTGERVVEPKLERIKSVYRFTDPNGIMANQIYTLPSDWADQLECVNSDDVKARYAHEIPGSLKYFIKYTNLFTSDDVIYQLKPILYCYWS